MSEEKKTTKKKPTSRKKVSKTPKTGEGKAKVKKVIKKLSKSKVIAAIMKIVTKMALDMLARRVKFYHAKLDEKIIEVSDPDLRAALDRTSDLLGAETLIMLEKWLAANGDQTGAIIVGAETNAPSLLIVAKGEVGLKKDRVWLDKGTLDGEGHNKLIKELS